MSSPFISSGKKSKIKRQASLGHLHVEASQHDKRFFSLRACLMSCMHGEHRTCMTPFIYVINNPYPYMINTAIQIEIKTHLIENKTKSKN